MKKYFILIITSFILLLAILFISPKIGKNLEKQQIDKINNSIVSIIKKDDLVLYQDDSGLDINVVKEKIKQDKLKWKWFFIDNNWTILTNKHIVDNKQWDYIVLTNSWETYKVKVLYIDHKSDFSLLKINSNKYEWINLYNSSLFVWQTIYKLEDNNLIKAKILKTKITLDKNSNNIIETSLNLKSGDSWSPLLINNFYVIWINTAKSNQLNKSYSTIITKNQIEQILKKLD